MTTQPVAFEHTNSTDDYRRWCETPAAQHRTTHLQALKSVRASLRVREITDPVEVGVLESVFRAKS